MSLKLSKENKTLSGVVNLTASKSESNRALIIKELCDGNFELNNLSEADDTQILESLLTKIKNGETNLNVGIAGTVMRFLTAFLSTKKGTYLLTGDQRMKERPIRVLVDALRQMGANISYQEKEGYPPIKITGNELNAKRLIIDGSISSQYISALIMLAPVFQINLEISFKGEVISKPYIDMTINMMHYFGVNVKWKGNDLIVESTPYIAKDFLVEADWSSASYWYGMVALSDKADITLLGLKKESLQGDSVVAKLYEKFGVKTQFLENGVKLSKHHNYSVDKPLQIDFVDCPDIAQTIAVTCAALNIEAKFTGLKTLRIKETDRVVALQNELNRLGYTVNIEADDLLVKKNFKQNFKWGNLSLKTYNDHRMAMAFAPLALLDIITIDNPEVVSKSYPQFWNDIKKVGFDLLDA